MADIKPTIALIGCGKMGSAMLRGWLKAGTSDLIFVLEPSGLPSEFKDHPSIDVIAEPADLPPCDILILAVKPQTINMVCQSLAPYVSDNTLVLSIAAGQTLHRFQAIFGDEQPIIRAMPNTPAAIGLGATVAVASETVTSPQADMAGKLLSAVGSAQWIADETQMDAVTALSGSGPAYVFYLIEVLAQAGQACGLPAEFAMLLARQTVIGSATLAALDYKTDAATLRQNVASPGGTTEAALKVLMENNRLQELFTQALQAATERSKQLSSEA